MDLPTSYKIAGAKALHSIITCCRSFRNKPNCGEFVRKGIRWQLDLNEGIDFAIYLLGGFENSLTAFYSTRICAGDVVVDVGANVGAHTLPLARIVGADGRVIAIEATLFAIEKLLHNLQLNPLIATPIKVIHAVLMESTVGTPQITITSSWPLSGETTDKRLDGGALKEVGSAEGTTLDEIVQEERLLRLDWIKIDVDGNETTVLRGGVETLRRFHPKILIEFSPYCHAPGSFEQLVGLLTDIGYQFYQIPSNKSLPNKAEKLVKMIHGRGSINVFAECTTLDG